MFAFTGKVQAAQEEVSHPFHGKRLKLAPLAEHIMSRQAEDQVRKVVLELLVCECDTASQPLAHWRVVLLRVVLLCSVLLRGGCPMSVAACCDGWGWSM